MQDSTAALVNAYTTITSTEINAWTMYVVATFAASGFGFSSVKLDNWKIALPATIGFLTFTYGQFIIVCDLISEREAVLEVLYTLKNQNIENLLVTFSKSGLTISGAIKTHVLVDFCVVTIIMFHSISRLMNKSA